MIPVLAAVTALFGHMPFEICSAPEIWERTMHEFVEDLEGVEVIADDFLIAGFGTTDDEVTHVARFRDACLL